MHRRNLLVCSTAAILCVLTGGVFAEEQGAASDFAGTFSGPYTFSSSNPVFGNQQGVLTLNIKPSGLVTGALVNTTIVSEAKGSGSVDEDGGFNFTVEFSDQVYTLKGTIVRTKSDRLKGTLTQYSGSNQAVGSVEFNIPAK
jgi:hypothetical protein